jgi:hypothetical protein
MAGALGVEVKAATGARTAWDTVTLLLTVLEPAALVAVSETVKVPEAAKAWVGFLDVLVPPSPKVQAQAVGVLVEVSLKVTVCPITGEAGVKLKLATGAVAAAVTTTLWLVLLDPPALLAVRVTV